MSDVTALGYGAGCSPNNVTANGTTPGAGNTFIGQNSGASDATDPSLATAAGTNAVATTPGVAVGVAARALADGSVAVGYEANASHSRSVALGRGPATTGTDQVMVGDRDVEITQATRGVIPKSPDGTRYRITVADGGTLTVTAV